MCLKSTLDKMLQISQILTQLSVDKMNIAGEMYTNSKYPTSSDDAMENECTSLDMAHKQFCANAIEAFIDILDLLLIKGDSKQEETIVLENVNSYLTMLKNLVSDLSGFSKQNIDNKIETNYNLAYDKLLSLSNETLSKKLLLCKMAIFN